MNLSDVPATPRKRGGKRRVGRGNGSGNGKTSGKGMRGAKCRSGAGVKLTYQGGQIPLFRTLPRRGFNNKRFRTPCDHVNICDLADMKDIDEVTPDILREAGLVSRTAKLVKVLGNGTLDRPLSVKAHRFSKTAIEKIEAAGGTAQIIQ